MTTPLSWVGDGWRKQTSWAVRPQEEVCGQTVYTVTISGVRFHNLCTTSGFWKCTVLKSIVYAQSRIMYVNSLHYKYICILMLWADYKPDQFINGPLRFINWSSTLHWLAHFKIYKTMCFCLETRPNGLEAGWILYKQPEWHASYTN